jgi:putative transposase
VLVHAANLTDGGTAHRVVKPLQDYPSRMEKILADAAYKTTFMDWVIENLLGVELEISAKPPSTKGFFSVKWRWVTEQTFGRFNFFRRFDKDHYLDN